MEVLVLIPVQLMKYKTKWAALRYRRIKIISLFLAHSVVIRSDILYGSVFRVMKGFVRSTE